MCKNIIKLAMAKSVSGRSMFNQMQRHFSFAWDGNKFMEFDRVPQSQCTIVNKESRSFAHICHTQSTHAHTLSSHLSFEYSTRTEMNKIFQERSESRQ